MVWIRIHYLILYLIRIRNTGVISKIIIRIGNLKTENTEQETILPNLPNSKPYYRIPKLLNVPNARVSKSTEYRNRRVPNAAFQFSVPNTDTECLIAQKYRGLPNPSKKYRMPSSDIYD